MEGGGLFRNQIGSAKQKTRWNKWEKTGTLESNLDPPVSFEGVADLTGRAF